MLNEHRDGVVDNSRRLWTILIFMVWHAIFVEDAGAGDHRSRLSGSPVAVLPATHRAARRT